MIWESIVLMTIVDLLIILVCFASLWILFIHRSQLFKSGSMLGLSVVVAGLLTIGLLYAADLFTAFVLPLLTTRATALTTVKNLHLNFTWIVVLVGTLAIFTGFALTSRRVFFMIDNLEKKTLELDRSNKVKDEFLSIMSHELRTPLNTIVGYTEMIKDKMLGEVRPEQERALGKVLTRSKDLLGMITGILEATSIGTGAVRVENTEVRLGEFFNELKLIYDSRMMKKKLALHWDYSADLPVVKTDREKLKHILQNLVHNAIKFTDTGHVTVSAHYRPKSRAVEFQVADSGIGISEAYLPSIFEIFQQVDSSETRVYGGVGVGLYIVKKFTDLLGGTVEVKSKPGKGSTFRVTIPCAS